MPLSGAVIVPGTLVVESDVKKIQHPAGGVVANIPVRDGMHVRAGELLLHLDETQLRANAQVLTQQLDQMRVRLARLMAERDGMDQPQMPHEMASRSGDQRYQPPVGIGSFTVQQPHRGAPQRQGSLAQPYRAARRTDFGSRRSSQIESGAA